MSKKTKITGSNVTVDTSIPVISVIPVTPATSDSMDKTSALELIKGLETAKARWIAFDKWVTSQADRPAGITKESITKGLILEADDIKVDSYHKDNVNRIMTSGSITVGTERLVNRKYASIRALVSMAYNYAGKGKSDKADTSKPNGKDTVISSEFGQVEANFETYLMERTDSEFDTLEAIMASVGIKRREKALSQTKKAVNQ